MEKYIKLKLVTMHQKFSDDNLHKKKKWMFHSHHQSWDTFSFSFLCSSLNAVVVFNAKRGATGNTV